MQLTKLLYTSHALCRAFDVDNLDILRSSLAFNQANDITGFLYRERDIFLQHLEGPEDAIDLVWQKISTDRRHFAINLIDRSPLQDRVFPDWAMGYESDTDVRLFNGPTVPACRDNHVEIYGQFLRQMASKKEAPRALQAS